MELEHQDAGTEDALTTCVHLAGGATLVVMALTEQFSGLPGAVAAMASAWYLLR